MERYSKKQRFCVILAGGDGTRLRPLTRSVSGDERPKQFCPFLRGWSPLQATVRRAGRSLDPERTLFVVTRAHERYYRDELAGVRPGRVLVQPKNQGTASAILLSLWRLRRLDPESSVVFLPSDHHYADECGFQAALQRAFEAAEEEEQRPILLGASPTCPETAYGWIEPGALITATARTRLFRVMRFWEKPSAFIAKMLLKVGCLWNTFVMVGRVKSFLDVIRAATPQLYEQFELHTATVEDSNFEPLYGNLETTDFSRDVLSRSPAELAVMNAGPVGWSDLGEPERVIRVISQLEEKCDWIDAWWRLRNP